MSNKVKVALIGAIATIIVACINKYEASNEQSKVTHSPEPTIVSISNRQSDDIVSEDNSSIEPTQEPVQETRVDLMNLKTIEGDPDYFWYSVDDKEDNLGNSDYNANIYCADYGSDEDIVYPIDGKYKVLSGDLALADCSKDTRDSVWIEFYSGDRKIGQTEKLKKGSRPIMFSIDVTGVDNLGIRTKSSGSGAHTLTTGFYLS